MTYELVKFEYKYFAYSRAEVIHLPNWFEKLFGKRAQLVTYIGWVDFWINETTCNNAPYAVRALITTEWHNHDLINFEQRVGLVQAALEATMKLLKRHADNN